MIIVSRWLRKQSILKFPRQSNMNTKGNAVPAGKFLLDVTLSNSVPHPFHIVLVAKQHPAHTDAVVQRYKRAEP